MDIARPFEAFLQEILLENSLRFFVLFFGFGVDSIWNILNHLDAIFEQTFSHIERIKIKKGALKLFYRFQTFKQQWNILLAVHRATLPNLVTSFPLQWTARLKHHQGSDGNFFHLAETKYRIILCNLSKSDLQYL